MGSKTLGSQKIAVIDYQMGNVHSVAKAFKLIGGDVVISNKKEVIERADCVVLPGVGAFADGMKNIKKFGLIKILEEEILKKRKPFLGICLGMQLLAKESDEFGLHKGLGWLDASVKMIKTGDTNLKVPHVGWNNIKMNIKCPLFKEIRQNSEFYFVHSFHVVCKLTQNVMAVCDYGIKLTAAIQKNNIFAVQFHPEKSQTAGLRVLENFLNLSKKEHA